MNLIYIADPMCSWCYGFTKPMEALLADPGDAAPLQLALVMGGLRPYTTEPLAAATAGEIFEHWRHVHEASGLPFAPAPNTALHRPGFVYDTEPASRAVVAVRSRWPKLVWRYFKSVQQAFYAGGQDVTQRDVLVDLAEPLGIPLKEFEAAFDSDEMREAARADFAQCQAWGLRGFPALVAEHGGELHLVAQGYTQAETLRERLAELARSGGGNLH
ncbi:DsbA family protein [Caldimonas tepidiphila]|uniref:DsbA family protein n=1 Tax=Caldimonas tepidiphila TaxID=2315841 RepID=UPI000E5B1F95|nr:DsbA family protein [Caldimonas tepidiphila]